MHVVHADAHAAPEVLRISVDTKAKVKIGAFSRGGLSRGARAVQAVDHDMRPSTILTPAGILEVDSNQLNIVFGQSRDTSDFVADALDTWWADRGGHYSHVKTLLINLDNGPEVSSSRTQFMKRLVEFSDQHQLTLQLAYYPPYHSKYNPIERCWGILENHWNGTLLTSVETALSWARTMTWRGIHPVVHFTQQVYETGVRIAKHHYQSIAQRLHRHMTLGKWNLTIQPNAI